MLGWSADGRVLVASHAGEANLRHLVVKAVSLDGAVERLPYGPAWGVAVHPTDDTTVLATPGSRVPAQWKRYRGGTAPRLWLQRSGADDTWHQLLADEPASLVDPMWVDGRLVFVSDRAATFPDHADEQANLWAWDTPGDGEPRQLTHQGVQEGYVRDAGTDGQPREVQVSLPGAGPTTYSALPAGHLDRLVPDHGGDASLVGWHGTVSWLAHRAGPARGPGDRRRGRGPAGGASPHRCRIRLVRVEDGAVTEVARSLQGEAESVSFHDHDPAFTRGGQHVVFLAERTFDPDYDAHEFALSFSGSTRPWLIPLAAHQPAPFGPSADGWPLSATDEDKHEPSGTEEASAPVTPTSTSMGPRGGSCRSRCRRGATATCAPPRTQCCGSPRPVRPACSAAAGPGSRATRRLTPCSTGRSASAHSPRWSTKSRSMPCPATASAWSCGTTRRSPSPPPAASRRTRTRPSSPST